MHRKVRSGARVLGVGAAVVIVALGTARAQDEGWPREIGTPLARIVIYQPQPESFEGDTLEARAAVSVTLTEQSAEPVFGAVWMTARVATSRPLPRAG